VDSGNIEAGKIFYKPYRKDWLIGPQEAPFQGWGGESKVTKKQPRPGLSRDLESKTAESSIPAIPR